MATDHVDVGATGDGFVRYDELTGPDLDPAHWSPARLPLPAGGDHLPLDDNAELTVGEGEVRVTIPRFSLSHDTFQPADSPKYLIFSTREFELPSDRPATFAVDLAVTNLGGEPEDYRRLHACEITLDRSGSTATCGSTGTPCTRPTAPSSPNASASGSGSGRCCRSGTAAVARSSGRAWTPGGAGSGSAG